MHGLMQTSFFFGYNAVVCFAFFLMLGSVGWRASLLFVRSIYKVSATCLPATAAAMAWSSVQGQCGAAGACAGETAAMCGGTVFCTVSCTERL